MEGANVDLLFIDSDNNKLFVGPYEFDINTLKPQESLFRRAREY